MFFLASFISFLLLVTAIYVAAEFATVSVKKAKIEARAEHGDELAKRLLPHIDDAHALDRYVAACQIGITLASLLMGSVGEKHLAELLNPYFVEIFGKYESAVAPFNRIAIILGFTMLQVLLGELVPKAVAMRFMERAALLLSVPMRWSLKVFAPFIAILNGSGTVILKAFGFSAEAHRHVHSPEELSRLLEHGVSSGTLEAEEHKRLNRVLQFGAKMAKDVMVPRTAMKAINIDDDLDKILQRIEDSPYTRFPVYKESTDKIIGMVHLKDICLALAKIPEGAAKPNTSAFLKPLMRRTVVFCPSSMHVNKVLEKLRAKRAYMAVLEDEYGGTDGLLTIEDLLEEVFGEINDEFDTRRTDISAQKDGSLLLNGTLSLDELQESRGIDLTQKEVHTIGGLVMHLAGEVPHVGFEASHRGYNLKVVKMHQRQVLKVMISKENA